MASVILETIKEGIKKFRRKVGSQFIPLSLREHLRAIQHAIEYQTEMLERVLTSRADIDSNIKSQDGQDVFVSDFFHNKIKGRYVELGAFDGVLFSNTYYLEHTFQWSGILIEPIKKQYELIKYHRSTDNIVLNVAISSDKDQVDFHVNDSNSISSITKSPNKNSIKMPAKRLDAIFKEHNITHIDYVSLDIEGYEYDALQSIDFDAVNITLMGIESNELAQQKKIEKFMTKKGFSFLLKKGVDYFYVNNNYSS